MTDVRGRNYAVVSVAFTAVSVLLYVNLLTCFGGWIFSSLARKYSAPRTTWRRVGTAAYLISTLWFFFWLLRESGLAPIR